MPITCDLAVLGAGPAGLTAAALASGAGLDTVLIARRGAMAEGARVLTGVGRLDGPGRLLVERDGGGRDGVRAGRIILAPGLRPATAPSLAADGRHILDWRQFAATSTAVETVVVVGAGVIGVGLATQLAAAGRRVRLVEMRETILGAVDPDLATGAATALRAQGVDLQTATRVVAADAAPEQVRLRLLDITNDGEQDLVAPLVVLAVGRRPDTRAVGLDTVTVETDRRGHVLTDANQETATPGLYAVGGAVPTVRTPTAARREARQAVDHVIGRPAPPIRYRELARRCDLQPEAAWVGLTALEAAAVGRVPRAAVARQATSLVKLVADVESGELLGAQLLGRGAATLAAALGRTLGSSVAAARDAAAGAPLETLVQQVAAELAQVAP